MEIQLRLALFIASFITVILVVRYVIKYKMNVKYGIIWILISLVVLTISIFPQLINYVSIVLGIYAPSNTVFLLTIFLSYILIFYIFIKISKQDEQIKNLTYELAVLKKKVDDEKNG